MRCDLLLEYPISCNNNNNDNNNDNNAIFTSILTP